MNNVKFNANQLLDSLNREMNLDEIKEIYKAMIAYNLGYDEITEEIDAKLNQVMEFYYENDNIANFINEDIMFYAEEILEN